MDKSITVRNPHFKAILDEMLELHDRKSHDYSEDSNVYSNFEFSAQLANTTVMQVFQVLIGVKLARLGQLLVGKVPKNEGLEDTLMDLCVYCVLMFAYWRQSRTLSLKAKEPFPTITGIHPPPGY